MGISEFLFTDFYERKVRVTLYRGLTANQSLHPR